MQLSRRDQDVGPEVPAAYTEEGIIGVRWWLADEIAETCERVFPEDLPHRLRELQLSPTVAPAVASDPTRQPQ